MQQYLVFLLCFCNSFIVYMHAVICGLVDYTRPEYNFRDVLAMLGWVAMEMQYTV